MLRAAAEAARRERPGDRKLCSGPPALGRDRPLSERKHARREPCFVPHFRRAWERTQSKTKPTVTFSTGVMSPTVAPASGHLSGAAPSFATRFAKPSRNTQRSSPRRVSRSSVPRKRGEAFG